MIILITVLSIAAVAAAVFCTAMGMIPNRMGIYIVLGVVALRELIKAGIREEIS